jgi:DNA (cytosine-5)-methyltransferase 1
MKQISVIDLFSGCGGFSLGFKKAGYKILGGIEYDKNACLTYANNLFAEVAPNIRSLHSMPRDITKYPPKKFANEVLGISNPINYVDVIVGGPPCQAFSRIGRAKLREIYRQENAHLLDSRAGLYERFLDFVEYYKPKAVLLENVPEIIDYGNINIAEEICISLKSLGYRPSYTLINSAHYGVPQTRVRFFLIALREDLQTDPIFPSPTHKSITTNNMYSYPERQILKNKQDNVSQFIYYSGKIIPNPELPKARTTADAISDLPPIYTDKETSREARDYNRVRAYIRKDPTNYQKIMRNWKGFEGNDDIYGHVIRYLKRDHAIFREMKEGDQYPEAHLIAKELFFKKIEELEKKGVKIKPSSKRYIALLDATIPPYSIDKFPNKWQKLHRDKPSHTITAHLGKDTYSHIHYDSSQARVISVREAARLQSFPDGFKFPNAMSHAFRQIGNSVPPLLAFELAKSIKKQIE